MKEIKPQEVIMLITPLSKVRDDGEVHSVRCSETFVQTLVRCGECAKWKHEETESHDFYRCEKGNHWSKKKNDDWFCADGKPKGVIEN